jgi:hypothetical protein
VASAREAVSAGKTIPHAEVKKKLVKGRAAEVVQRRRAR